MNFLTKIFFPNLELLNLGCGLSASAAHTPVFTVTLFVILCFAILQSDLKYLKKFRLEVIPWLSIALRILTAHDLLRH